MIGELDLFLQKNVCECNGVKTIYAKNRWENCTPIQIISCVHEALAAMCASGAKASLIALPVLLYNLIALTKYRNSSEDMTILHIIQNIPIGGGCRLQVIASRHLDNAAGAGVGRMLVYDSSDALGERLNLSRAIYYDGI